ncbi:MAG TPA: ferritin family protein [Anaerolineae bacterium]|nr:ferritin family protein [Anaerolineae bacterium]HNS52900.1 ferritin family protein [Anaerolineae bacterium]
MTKRLGIEQAIEIAMEGELTAHAFYAQAAAEIEDLAGRDLLGRLAAFEQHHYQKLADLSRALRQEHRFIYYEGVNTLEHLSPLVGRGEAAGSLLEQYRDVPGILSQAIENEKSAGLRYRLLAEETSDPDGQDMFRKLSAEEFLHQHVLEDEFFSLSNKGVWGWSGMYGE